MESRLCWTLREQQLLDYPVSESYQSPCTRGLFGSTEYTLLAVLILCGPFLSAPIVVIMYFVLIPHCVSFTYISLVASFADSYHTPIDEVGVVYSSKMCTVLYDLMANCNLLQYSQ